MGLSSIAVAVIGQFKQGKSYLVNALVGRDVCPVDDDIATSAITVCFHAPDLTARVRRVEAGEVVAQQVEPGAIRSFVTEQGNPGNRLGVEAVEIGVPSPLLAEGLTLIDTPGTGGIIREYAATTLRFLTVADALLFVTDASAELSDSDLKFLERAKLVCPNVLVALTKIDVYPEWRRIADLDRDHLLGIGIDSVPIPVASTLAAQARMGDDESLADESGIERLTTALRDQVLAGAKERSAVRALHEAESALAQLATPLRTEISAIEDPEHARELIEELRAAETRLQGLREGAARWSTVLTDGFIDLRSEVDFRLRATAKDVARDSELRLEEVDPGSEWAALGAELQTRMAEEAAALFDHIDAGAAEICAQVDDLLRAADVAPLDLVASRGLDVDAIWSSSERTLAGETPGVLSLGLTGLRGASSGVIMLGMVARFASIAAMNPLALGVGAAFGAKQVLDVRKQSVQRRRQEARTLQRQFLDQVQLELSNRSRRAIQDAQRSLRDHYVEQIKEISQTCATTIASLQHAIEQDKKTGPKRIEDLRGELSRLDAIIERTSSLASTIGRPE